MKKSAEIKNKAKESYDFVILSIEGMVKSLGNFIRSGYLSLVLIIFISLILFNMNQAYTMLVYMLEEDRISLLISFYFVNAIALAVSHYPIYIYYYWNFNGSKNKFDWQVNITREKRIFKNIFFTYKRNNKPYRIDVIANYLRYSLGVFVYIGWIAFIYKSIAPNLLYSDLWLSHAWYPYVIGSFFIFPMYIYMRYKYKIVHDQLLDKYLFFQRAVTFIGGISFLLLVLTLVFLMPFNMFSRLGLVLVMIYTYCLLCYFLFFRLIKGDLEETYRYMKAKRHPLTWYVRWIKKYNDPVKYLQLFMYYFLVAVAYVVYCNIAAVNVWKVPTCVIPILLAYMYIFYWVLANLNKYFSVAKKAKFKGSNVTYARTSNYKVKVVLATLIAGILVYSFFTEKYIHQLDTVSNTNALENLVSEKNFIAEVAEMKGDYVFFVSSHGGGLKSNIWTLNILNAIQHGTNGSFTDKVVSMSGASGGSLGLALYTALCRDKGKETSTIQYAIDSIAQQDYASSDLSMTFGLDFIRKVWPFSYGLGLKDRAYYSMVRYQNLIEGKEGNVLSLKGFREYWMEAYRKTGYFPSLVMNTAGTSANRGVLWSVKHSGKFENIFPYADNLADLYNHQEQTLPFYQAVSMTNRFPVFSPAAKIKGYGHYMDAGVLDNSGLLGNLDVYQYLSRKKDTIFKNKKVVFVDIMNSKTLYVKSLVEELLAKDFDKTLKDEFEKDNLLVNLTTALDFNKIPMYLEHYIKNWADHNAKDILHLPIYLPHKVTEEDIEKFIGGSLQDHMNEKNREKIKIFLEEKNAMITSITNTQDIPFTEPWKYYEPTLSRHMGESSYRYMKTMIQKHKDVTAKIGEIKDYIIQNKESKK